MKRLIQKQLLDWKTSKIRKPLILLGARQTGKTWILKEFGKEFTKYHHIDLAKNTNFHNVFEDLDPKKIISRLNIHHDFKINPETDLIIFDEIQECPRSIQSLKYFCEDLPSCAVVAAGSHIGIKLNNQSYPVGKVETINLFPMSFGEFLLHVKPELFALYDNLDIGKSEHDMLSKYWWSYLFCGGMPEAVALFDINEPETIENCRKIQKHILDGYSSDIAKHAGKENATHIQGVFSSIPNQLQKAIDNNVKRFMFKHALNGVSKFHQAQGPISWLVNTGTVLKVMNISDIQLPLGLTEKENLFKLLYSDIGLLNTALDLTYSDIIKQAMGSYKGFIVESAIAQEIASQGYVLRYWKTRDSSKLSEVEFIIRENNFIIPIEVKSGAKSTKSRSLAVYKREYNPEVAIKFTANPLRFEKNHINAPLYLAGKIPDLVSDFIEKNKF